MKKSEVREMIQEIIKEANKPMDARWLSARSKQIQGNLSSMTKNFNSKKYNYVIETAEININILNEIIKQAEALEDH